MGGKRGGVRRPPRPPEADVRRRRLLWKKILEKRFLGSTDMYPTNGVKGIIMTTATFGRYHPTIRSTGEILKSPQGSAGIDSEARKGLESIQKALLLGEKIEGLEILQALFDKAKALSEMAEEFDSSDFAEEAIIAFAALHAACYDFVVASRANIDGKDILAIDVGSFGKGEKKEGEWIWTQAPYERPIASRATLQRHRCRVALEREREIMGILNAHNFR